ncbi:phosphatase PAP2 family protein [Urechidicola vernalis]|uniref:Phosphatase PAP2 family protein n=1 Tax=Urechidicola vernalis TaxID=3075600 RepID=A0ABU2Y1T1_9FLAO|nr:phosphatase PAP2 family protein [Urechidicola sp. P050]MDT0552168.1 phosphatase PAP2 family protein [Urechidicola sp. P050]
MLEKINKIDTELLIYLNGLGSTTWDGFWMFMTTTVYSVPFYLIALYFVYKIYGTKKTLYALLFIAILITASDQLSNAFKYGFGRLRPCHNEEVKGLIRLVKDSCGGYYSFFSAHASTSMAIVVYFALLIKSKVKYFALFLIFWAVLIGYSRIYIGVHYPFDVLFGFTVGGTIGFAIYLLFNVFIKKYIDK